MYYYYTICEKQYEHCDGGPGRPYTEKVVLQRVLLPKMDTEENYKKKRNVKTNQIALRVTK